jgi:hypothetical protein
MISMIHFYVSLGDYDSSDSASIGMPIAREDGK